MCACVSLVVGWQRNQSNAADLAAAAISITAAREKVVNFIRPFQHLGLTVVTRRPNVNVNLPYSFGIFQPLDTAVWGLILFALIVVSTPDAHHSIRLYICLYNVLTYAVFSERRLINHHHHHHHHHHIFVLLQLKLETKAMTTSSHCNTGRMCVRLPITTRENTPLAIHVVQKIAVIRAQKIGKFAV